MAKLKGPLFSLGASQKLGNALVYFSWKGLDVVREYVVPSNPQTTGQTTQRGYLTEAVTAIHTIQAIPATGLDEEDIRAYALLASIIQSATTWFNQLVRIIVDQLVAGRDWSIWRAVALAPGANQLTLTASSYQTGAIPTNCTINFGTSRTALFNTQATTRIALGGGVVIPGLVTGVKYYVQIRPTAPAGQIGSNSGIYYAVPT